MILIVCLLFAFLSAPLDAVSKNKKNKQISKVLGTNKKQVPQKNESQQSFIYSYCTICHAEEILNPFTLSCGHKFCGACIKESYEMALENSKQCPNCRNSFTIPNEERPVSSVLAEKILQNPLASIILPTRPSSDVMVFGAIALHYLFSVPKIWALLLVMPALYFYFLEYQFLKFEQATVNWSEHQLFTYHPFSWSPKYVAFSKDGSSLTYSRLLLMMGILKYLFLNGSI